MAKLADNRRASAQSTAVVRLTNANQAINTSGDASVNRVLNRQLTNSSALQIKRERIKENVRTLNREYIQNTKRVLNDKTLDFLIEHSNIDAPTFTAFFAGFELARASRADKLDEERKLEIEALDRQDQILQSTFQQDTAVDERRLDRVAAQEDRAADAASRVFKSQTDALAGDVQNRVAAEAAEELAGNQLIREGVKQDGANLRNENSNNRLLDAAAQRDEDDRNRILNLQGVNRNEEPVGGEVAPSLEVPGPAPVDPVSQADTGGGLTDEQLRTNRNELLVAAFDNPRNGGVLESLREVDAQLNLTDDEARLTDTLGSRFILGNVVENNPDDVQASNAFSDLSSDVQDQQFRLNNPDSVTSDDDDLSDATRLDQAEGVRARISNLGNVLNSSGLEESDAELLAREKELLEQQLEALA